MKNSRTTNFDINTVLVKAQSLLDQGQTAEALEMLSFCGRNTHGIENAKGVCLLRLGRYDAALKILRELVFPRGAFSIPDDTPTVFRTNYITAMLLSGSVMTAGELLKDVPDRSHSAVQRLKTAIRQWRRSLPWWRQLLLWVGAYPDKPVRLDYPPGDLDGLHTEDIPGPRKRVA